jgi:hypothetical protein
MITGTCDNHHSTNKKPIKGEASESEETLGTGFQRSFHCFFVVPKLQRHDQLQARNSTNTDGPNVAKGRFAHQQPKAPNPSCCAYVLHTFHLPAVPEKDQLRYLSQTAIIEN